MSDELAISNNNIIVGWNKDFIQKVTASKKAFDIKHNRGKPVKVGSRLYKTRGEITRIGVFMSKGDIMTHKGKGKYPQNRKAKPWFNPIADVEVDELANRIAINSGDVIKNRLLID